MAEKITSQTSETDEEPNDPADLDVTRVGDHERDQDDEQDDRGAGVEVEASPMRLAREARATRLA